MKNELSILLFKLLPKGLISRITGYIAIIPFPQFILKLFIKYYCNIYKVNNDEILYPDNGFKTIDHFFTRKLKDGVHKVDAVKNLIVSPVDAKIVEFGKINICKIIQAKGIEFTVKDLIPSEMANRFIDGSYITLYLSPADYHRIHSPVNGSVIGYFYIPGKLFPVRELIINNIKGLFTKNERVLSYIQNNKGIVAVCKIGAMNVGKITLNYSKIKTNRFIKKQEEYFYPAGTQPSIKKGDELGIFHLGSTIILLFEKGSIRFNKLRKGQKVRVGQKIASYL